MMPLNLVLVRHGESEGNVAHKSSRRGNNQYFTEEFRGRHSSRWRLTDKGIWQAEQAGVWIHRNLRFDRQPAVNDDVRNADRPVTFDRRYVSEYIRAIETAIHLHVDGPPWYVDFNLRERDQGIFELMPDDERRKLFASEVLRREIDSFFWGPLGGVSMADLCLRIVRILDTLHRECSKMNVIIVCHGEVMWAFRVILERMTQQRYHQLEASEDPRDQIHNAQIIHYSRINPQTGAEEQYVNWMRSICPTDLSRSHNEWEPIVRPRFTDADLGAIIESTPRIVNEEFQPPTEEQ